MVKRRSEIAKQSCYDHLCLQTIETVNEWLPVKFDLQKKGLSDILAKQKYQQIF